jgi:hypothetical protein
MGEKKFKIKIYYKKIRTKIFFFFKIIFRGGGGKKNFLELILLFILIRLKKIKISNKFLILIKNLEDLNEKEF